MKKIISLMCAWLTITVSAQTSNTVNKNCANIFHDIQLLYVYLEYKCLILFHLIEHDHLK
jgi:hypothetical protein